MFRKPRKNYLRLRRRTARFIDYYGQRGTVGQFDAILVLGQYEGERRGATSETIPDPPYETRIPGIFRLVDAPDTAAPRLNDIVTAPGLPESRSYQIVELQRVAPGGVTLFWRFMIWTQLDAP